MCFLDFHKRFDEVFKGCTCLMEPLLPNQFTFLKSISLFIVCDFVSVIMSAVLSVLSINLSTISDF